jgi:predicted DNA-binding protein (UPF0251 family)
VSRLPLTDHFLPAPLGAAQVGEIILTVEEYEALRLKDLMQMDQRDAALKMGISQATFHRLVTGARRKVADAIVGGKAIRIYGGSYKTTKQ